MDVKYFHLDELQPYEKNPRKNDSAVDVVANSIKEFGFKVPIVIDADNVIVAGHTRYKAARKLGLDSVPCVIADDLSPEKIKAFRLADNKTAEFAAWDFELLDTELSDISFDMNNFGFKLADFGNIDDFFEEIDSDKPHAEIDSDKPHTEINSDKPHTTIICPHCGRKFAI